MKWCKVLLDDMLGRCEHRRMFYSAVRDTAERVRATQYVDSEGGSLNAQLEPPYRREGVRPNDGLSASMDWLSVDVIVHPCRRLVRDRWR